MRRDNRTMGGRTLVARAVAAFAVIWLFSPFVRPCEARVSIVVFPLENRSGDSLAWWLSYAIPESFSRAALYSEGMQIWSPVFMAEVDTSVALAGSDSLLLLHQKRWKWDLAVSGEFSERGDSIGIRLRVLSVHDGGVDRLKIDGAGTALLPLCHQLLLRTLSESLHPISRSDSVELAIAFNKVSGSATGYDTYCAGFGYEMRGQRAAALSAYRMALDHDAGFAQCWLRIGHLFAAAQNTVSARSAYQRALAAAPTDPLVVAQAADFFIENEPPAKAGKFIGQQNEVLVRSSEGMKVLGKELMGQGEYQRAVAALTKAIALGPADLETEFLQGSAYLSSGQVDLAAEIFNRLIGRRPDHIGYYALLGEAYRSAGRLMESVRILESAVKIAPDNITVLLGLAHTYFDLGWLQKAEQLLLHAREVNPEVAETDLNLGVVYWLMGRQTESRALLDKAGRSPSSAQAALNDDANILFAAKEITKALELYRRADKAGGRNEVVLYNLGVAYLRLGKLKEANESFDELLRLAPERLDVLTNQAAIAQARGDTAGAVLYYRKILEQSPYHEGALRGLIAILNSQGKFQESIEVIERYLNDFSTAKEFRYLQAETYRLMGWSEVAEMKYEFMMKDFPNYADGFVGYARTLHDLVAKGKKIDYDHVIYELKSVSEKCAQSPEPDYYAGLIYAENKGFGDLALQEYHVALARATDPVMKKKIMTAIDRVNHP